jgi:hypothetical protein
VITKSCDVCGMDESRDVHLNEVMEGVHICIVCADKAGLMEPKPHSKVKHFVGGMWYAQIATRQALRMAVGRLATVRTSGEQA